MLLRERRSAVLAVELFGAQTPDEPLVEREPSTRLRQHVLSWALAQELHMTRLQIVDATLDLHLTCRHLKEEKC